MKKLILLLFLTVFGCHKGTENVVPDKPMSVDEHFISAAKATQIASTNQDSNGRGSSKAIKIKNQLTIDDADDKSKKTSDMPVFYIINYEEGGYKIISADDRLGPVLADVPAGPGIDKTSDLPGGLLIWMKSTKDQIQNIRKLKLKKKDKKGARIATTIIAEKSPLLQTYWGQSCGFNTSILSDQVANSPYNPCRGNNRCDRPPTGCVATAMAQVIRYWGGKNSSFKTPFIYNWDEIPLGYSASLETSRLMRDAGVSVNTSYGCNSSGASENSVAPALKRIFGYSSANISIYRPHDVVNNLNMDWPVIMSGCSGNFLWWGTGDCHMWVCDGYRLIERRGSEYCYWDEVYDEDGEWICYTPIWQESIV